MSHLENRRTILVYRDKLFLGSESFIPRAYRHFQALSPIYVGNGDGAGPDGATVISLDGADGLSAIDNALLRTVGRVPDPFVGRLRSEAPRLVHAHFGKSGAYAMPIAAALGLPLVVTFHGGDAAKDVHYRPNPFAVYNRRRHRLFQQAAGFIAVSDFVRRKLISRGGPAEKITVIHNGVDPDHFQVGAKAKEILFIGRMVEKKGIDVLAKALSQLGKQLDGWQVRLLGDGPLRAKAEALVASTGVNCRFEGWVPADQVAGYLERAAVVVVPSKTASSGDAEGLPMTVMEGMMSGAAVVGAHHAGIPEAIVDGTTGLVFPEGNSEALAEALQTVCMTEGLAAGLGAAGRTRAEVHFNAQIQSRTLEAYLASFLDAEAA